MYIYIYMYKYIYIYLQWCCWMATGQVLCCTCSIPQLGWTAKEGWRVLTPGRLGQSMTSALGLRGLTWFEIVGFSHIGNLGDDTYSHKPFGTRWHLLRSLKQHTEDTLKGYEAATSEVETCQRAFKPPVFWCILWQFVTTQINANKGGLKLSLKPTS